MQQENCDRVLRRREVEEITGLKRSTILKHVQNGSFPQPIRLTDGGRRGAIGWRQSSIQEWIASREPISSNSVAA